MEAHARSVKSGFGGNSGEGLRAADRKQRSAVTASREALGRTTVADVCRQGAERGEQCRSRPGSLEADPLPPRAVESIQAVPRRPPHEPRCHGRARNCAAGVERRSPWMRLCCGCHARRSSGLGQWAARGRTDACRVRDISPRWSRCHRRRPRRTYVIHGPSTVRWSVARSGPDESAHASEVGGEV